MWWVQNDPLNLYLKQLTCPAMLNNIVPLWRSTPHCIKPTYICLATHVIINWWWLCQDCTHMWLRCYSTACPLSSLSLTNQWECRFNNNIHFYPLFNNGPSHIDESNNLLPSSQNNGFNPDVSWFIVSLTHVCYNSRLNYDLATQYTWHHHDRTMHVSMSWQT